MMDTKKMTMKQRAAILLAASGLVLSVGAGSALAMTLQGDNGPNRLVGAAQNDVLRGLGGRDFLAGKGNFDRLFGGRGNDVISARDGEGDLINCGPGKDTVVADADNEDRMAGNCELVRKPATADQPTDDNGNDVPEIGDDNDGVEVGDDNDREIVEVDDENGDGAETGDDNE